MGALRPITHPGRTPRAPAEAAQSARDCPNTPKAQMVPMTDLAGPTQTPHLPDVA